MTIKECIEFANSLKNNYTIDFDKLSEFCDMVISELSENKEGLRQSDNAERLMDIREWLIENIFRDDYVMFSDAREVGQIDLIEVIASLYNEYHNAVMGEPYDYMFHWANKCGSWVEEDLFDRVLKKEDADEGIN